MNLEESNSYQDNVESRDRKKRGVMLSIILCGVLIALLFIMIVIISYQDSITEKFFINGTQTSKLSNKIYGAIDGVVYIDVKELSSVLGYTYTKGEYKKYNENEDSCYLQNDFEIITLTAGDNNICYTYLFKNTNSFANPIYLLGVKLIKTSLSFSFISNLLTKLLISCIEICFPLVNSFSISYALLYLFFLKIVCTASAKTSGASSKSFSNLAIFTSIFENPFSVCFIEIIVCANPTPIFLSIDESLK